MWAGNPPGQLPETVQHFFGGFDRLFQGITEPRTLAYITYPLVALMATGVLMYLFRLKARRQVTNLLRWNGPSAGFVFSLMTEFIENPDVYPNKQDCELEAFYRLAERLKKAFPRLPICLLLDGLFAGGPTFSICEKNHWKYLVVLQENDIPYINSEFNIPKASLIWPL